MSTTIAVKPETKTMFDEMQKRLGKDFTQDGAIIALIEGYAGDDLLPMADEYEIASFGEVCRHLIGVKAVMRSILSHRQELSDEALAEQAKRAEELAATVAERDETIAARDETIAAQASELDELRAKAATVDEIAKAMRDAADAAAKREEAQVVRFDKAMALLESQVKRYEDELAKVNAKLAEVEQERDNMAHCVRKLQGQLDEANAKLAEVDQAEQE